MNGCVAEDGVVAIVSDDEDGHGAACRIPERALQSLPQLEVLFDSTGKGLGLPAPLSRAYGGDLGLAGDCLVANFVESVDGVVAFPDAAGESGAVVSGGSAPDRFLMGLLRACAGAGLIRAGALRAAPGGPGFPGAVFSARAPPYEEARRAPG